MQLNGRTIALGVTACGAVVILASALIGRGDPIRDDDTVGFRGNEPANDRFQTDNWGFNASTAPDGNTPAARTANAAGTTASRDATPMASATLGVARPVNQALVEAAEANMSERDRRRMNGWREWMDRVDTDGDGEISLDEYTADRERRAAERDARRAAWVERWDTDGDGEISREERNAARQAEREERRLRRFDENNDGELDGTETAKMEQQEAIERAEREAWRQRRDEQRLAAHDADGDGQLNDAERQAAEQAERARRDERRAQEAARRQEWTDRWDADGDGSLSTPERYEAFIARMESAQIDRMVRTFDSDGDSALGLPDLEGFFEMHEQGDPAADLDRDGYLTQEDMRIFTEAVQQGLSTDDAREVRGGGGRSGR